MLKIFFKSIFFGHVFFSVCFASVRGTLELETRGRTFTNGDIVDSQLSIWPWKENLDKNFFKKYIGEKFIEYFHVTNVKNVQVLNEFLKADLRIIIKKSFNGEDNAQFSYGEYEIPIVIKKTGFISNKKNVEKFILFSQFEKIDRTLYHVVMTLLIFLGFILCWWGFLYYKKRKRRMEIARKIQKEREELIFLMKNIKNKEDIQKLYFKKNKMKEVVNSSRKFKEILSMIDEHQYKNHIADEIIVEIRNKINNGI